MGGLWEFHTVFAAFPCPCALPPGRGSRAFGRVSWNGMCLTAISWLPAGAVA